MYSWPPAAAVRCSARPSCPRLPVTNSLTTASGACRSRTPDPGPRTPSSPQPRPVLLFVVAAELAVVVLDRPPPRLVLRVPAHGLGKPTLERHQRRPPQVAQLRRRERVAAVVADAVGDRVDQRLGLAEQAQHLARDRDVLPFVAAGEVYNIAGSAVLEDEQDGPAVVGYVQPVADVAAVAVQRQAFVAQSVGDEKRDQLLRVLVRTVLVRRAGDHQRHAVRRPVREGG